MRKLLLIIFGLLMLPASAHASSHAWSGCKGNAGSGNFDAAGRIYIACGSPSTINIFASNGHRIAALATNSQASDVAPNAQGTAFYMATTNGIKKYTKQSGVWKPTNWQPEKYSLWGLKYKAFGRYLDVDAQENIYVADGSWSPNQTHMIIKYNRQGRVVTQFGGWEKSWRQGIFYWGLAGIDVSANGQTLLSAEVGNNRIQTWQRQSNGSYKSIRTLGASEATNSDRFGYCDGDVWSNRFAAPYDVARDAIGNIYVLNTTCSQIFVFGPDYVLKENIQLLAPDYPAGRPHEIAVAANGTMLIPEKSASLGQPYDNALMLKPTHVYFKKYNRSRLKLRCGNCKSTLVKAKFYQGRKLIKTRNLTVYSKWVLYRKSPRATRLVIEFDRLGPVRVQQAHRLR